MKSIITNIQKNTLDNLEFPMVLKQVSEFCITQKGKETVTQITPYKRVEEISPELHRVKEIKDSFNSDSPIPNHGFESIEVDEQRRERRIFSLAASDRTRQLLCKQRAVRESCQIIKLRAPLQVVGAAF